MSITLPVPMVYQKAGLKFCSSNKEGPGERLGAQPGYKKQYSSTRL